MAKEYYSGIQEVLRTLVYVISLEGKRLMPCTEAKARHLLKVNKAKCIRKEPFIIQLKFKCENKIQPITLGVDAGSKHIGISASTEKKELFSADVEIRQDVSKNIATKREMRRTRRNRKTRYRPARFNNRVKSKHKGWLAPSIEHKINTHINIIDKVCNILPITKIIVETAQFDIQKLKNPDISGKEYQQGEQLGFSNVREYVLFRDKHTCQYCKGKSKGKVLNVHHLESRKTGGNAPNNLITLCKTCHEKYHKGEIALKQKRGKSYKNATFMGIMRKTLLCRLKSKYTIPVVETYGYITKSTRISLGLPKEHYVDAYCITNNITAKRLDYYLYIKQVRRHNRQIHKMTILKGGYRKRNQAPYEVFGFRLFDKVRVNGYVCFIFSRRLIGYFDIRSLDKTISFNGVSYKKINLISKRRSFLIERRLLCGNIF